MKAKTVQFSWISLGQTLLTQNFGIVEICLKSRFKFSAFQFDLLLLSQILIHDFIRTTYKAKYMYIFVFPCINDACTLYVFFINNNELRLYLCWLKKKLVIIYFVNIFRSQFTFTVQKWWRCWGGQEIYKAWYHEARGELSGNISHIRLLYYILWVFIIIILFLVEIMHLSLYLSA